MIANPEKYVERFADAGAKIITVHAEATQHLHRVLQQIRATGALAGVALNPGTSPECLKYVLGDFDLALVMSVNPGFGGQKFMPSSIAKCEYLSKKRAELGLSELIIEVDGGISASNSRLLFDAGAEALVAGSSVFGATDPEQAIIDMLNS
jgi:ribulose-phosphate 3-epimerase